MDGRVSASQKVSKIGLFKASEIQFGMQANAATAANSIQFKVTLVNRSTRMQVPVIFQALLVLLGYTCGSDSLLRTPLSFDFFVPALMSEICATEGYAVGPQEPGAVDFRLEELLHHPETATDWLDCVRHFNAPFRPDEEDMRMFDLNWMVFGQTELCWLDLWVFFCLARQVPQDRAVEGPDQGWDFSEEWDDRAARFGQ